VIIRPRAKDESDTELAVGEAIRRGATEIAILGGLGGLRFDHALANVLLLAAPALGDCDVRIVDTATTVRIIDGARRPSVEIRGAAGDTVSLLPLSESAGSVRTEGLAYPTGGSSLEQGLSRGLSNVMEGDACRVSVGSGRLAVIHIGAGREQPHAG
jgi:thiamine pyrophosphokinase